MTIRAATRKSRTFLAGIALIFNFFAGGCETAPQQMIYVPPDMLPESDLAKPAEKSALFAGQTLVIAPVTGVGASNLRVLSGAAGVAGTAQIWSQTFHKALFEALQGSGLFSEVVEDGTAHYLLHADILQQTVAGYGATFKVHYVLNDTQSGRSLWQQDITTTYAFPASLGTFVTPYNTEVKALTRACGKNIESLIAQLATEPNTKSEGSRQGVW